MTVRGWAWLAFAVLALAWVVLVAVLIPWDRPPAPRADQLAALAEMPADKVARAKAFAADRRLAAYTSMGVGLAVALLLGLTPLGARLAGVVGGPWWVRAIGGGLLVLLVSDVITLPFAAWAHTISVRYGLSTQTWGPWTVDLLKGYGIAAVLASIVLIGYFGLARLAPNWWWAWAAAGAAVLTLVLTFVFPVLVEPVFNKFTPMPEGEQRTTLMALAQRDGVPVRDVLVADASRRTRAVNAYVSGLGPTRRIVVYDTLLKEAAPNEVESVVAHELGHAKDNDVLGGTLIGALGAALSVVGLYLLGGWGRLLKLAGVDSITEPRAIGLLLAIAAIAVLLSTPLQSVMSRLVEARADKHALQLTDDPATFERMQLRLATVNLSDPDPPATLQFLFGSHPTTVERIAAARASGR